jgi:glucan-binding YG repeat protein
MKCRLTLSLALITTLALFFLPTAFAGKVYKWVDEEGNVQYSSQKPPSTGAQEIKVKSKPASSARNSEPESEDDKQEDKAKSEEENVKVSSEKEAAEIEQKNEEIRKKNCSIAKRRVATIGQGGRMYEVDEKGERTYWDDTTRAAKMQEAQAQVDEWCK